MSSDYISSSGYEEAADSNTDEPAYEVEKILNSRKKKGFTEYLVKWKGFNEEDATWEKENGLNCRSLIKQYIRSKKKRKTPEKLEKNVKMKKTSPPEPIAITDAFIKMKDGKSRIYYRVLYSDDSEALYPSKRVVKDIPDLGVQFLANNQVPPGRTYFDDKIINPPKLTSK